MRFSGAFTALITPFKRGAVDEEALKRLVRLQVQSGVSGLVPCGSTGEAATLSASEKERIVRTVIAAARGRVQVIAGVGTNDTKKTVEAARSAEGWGADALLVLAPYYNKPTQGGLYLHFKAVADAVGIPIVVYNIPGRTGVNIQPSTLARIAADCRNVLAVKEASGSLDQASEILALAKPELKVLSGDDSLTLPMMSVGASGAVSVVSNLLPKETSELCRAALAGDFAKARKLHSRMFPLIKALFVETNPIPVKAAAHFLGLCENELRLPLTPMSPEAWQKLHKELERAGLIRLQRSGVPRKAAGILQRQ
ncbi:MAG: 4-hydroxy-tetrahydrodipicolinate synthase [Elusimicrobia bacterium]|nr:4-hydroxy-tetrahydrodipicolinate synthase [Elusimicrobiota bacterium]